MKSIGRSPIRNRGSSHSHHAETEPLVERPPITCPEGYRCAYECTDGGDASYKAVVQCQRKFGVGLGVPDVKLLPPQIQASRIHTTLSPRCTGASENMWRESFVGMGWA
jgi:hypothetical protein